MSILANRIYYIDSEKRVAGTPSNFSYALDIPEGEKYDSCCVLSMTVPRSFYLVRDKLNIFKVEVDGTTYQIAVPPGNYNARDFMPLLRNLLQPYVNMSISFDSITGKYAYSYTDEKAVKFIFEHPSRIGLQMGFDEVSTHEFVGKKLTSVNVLNFISTSTLFVHSDMVNDSSSILQELYADNTAPFSNLVYHCQYPGMYNKRLKNAKNGVFNFSLVDEHDQEVDLNGHHILMTILLYKKENLPLLFKTIFANQ